MTRMPIQHRLNFKFPVNRAHQAASEIRIKSPHLASDSNITRYMLNLLLINASGVAETKLIVPKNSF